MSELLKELRDNLANLDWGEKRSSHSNTLPKFTIKNTNNTVAKCQHILPSPAPDYTIKRPSTSGKESTR